MVVETQRSAEQNMPGGNSAVVPPDPMPNSAVKRRSADGSVGSPHARVGNCQTSIRKSPVERLGFFAFVIRKNTHSPQYFALRQGGKGGCEGAYTGM